jgi:NAD(P)-dependent dehydrogenase (short-subunit alcohol dehydrogenase family)
MDIRAMIEVARTVGRELEAAGGLDLLVQNAGMGISGPVEEVDAAAFQRQFAVNLFGPLELVRQLLPKLRARRGRIVFIGSLAGRFALPFQAHYAASKAAIASFSDSLRMEFAPFGVRVSCVEPGDFATGFTDAREKHATPGSPYAAKPSACLEAAEGQERGGGEPDWVARVVEALSADEHPPARRPVGKWARTMCLLQRLLPDFVREWGTTSQYRQ